MYIYNGIYEYLSIILHVYEYIHIYPCCRYIHTYIQETITNVCQIVKILYHIYYVIYKIYIHIFLMA